MAASQPTRPRKNGVMGKFPKDLSFKRLQWGAVEASGDDSGFGIGHATFGTEVSLLVEGKLYA